MSAAKSEQHVCCPTTLVSHPNDPIPKEPPLLPRVQTSCIDASQSSVSSATSLNYADTSEPQSPLTPATEPEAEDSREKREDERTAAIEPSGPRRRRASTKLISQGPDDVRKILVGKAGANTELVGGGVCCGGGCCSLDALVEDLKSKSISPIIIPDNDAFRSLRLKLGPLSLDSELTKIVELPLENVSFSPASQSTPAANSSFSPNPPKFVTPHPPHEVYSSKVHHSRELTKPNAEKRTYHFELDVTDYPDESGDVDFIVGGAVGVCAPNSEDLVEEVFDLLGVPEFVRGKPITLKTGGGRWPTIWGDEMSRELTTTRRELLTWCSDLQSYPPTKQLLRLLAEYADAPNEKKILLYLCSAQGQAAFCDLRTGPHITIAQLLHAFPSSKPPLAQLLSVLDTLMPRFYSLSQDPQISCLRDGTQCRRLIEMAVTVHETPNWRGGPRTGVGSGFLERTAKKLIEAEKNGINPADLDLRVPMFRGLMANPLARQFVTDGPMLLIGAGVGIAPFRGFVQNRLKSANCANKVWVLQGVRDSLLDELYSGEWGIDEEKVKKVVQSRAGEGIYVQDEVRRQSDLVWFVINALDGRVFVCGSSKGMGEGVEKALVDVVMDKGKLNMEEAEAFWKGKKEAQQYIAETW
ncbi:MAG: hypothetical protein Q9190_002030 [Brigantiaea leucoxantha]